MNPFKKLRRWIKDSIRLYKINQSDKISISKDFREELNSILIIRNDAIGDYLLYRPFLRLMLKEDEYKNKTIYLAGNIIWKDLAENLDADIIHHFIWIDFNKFQFNMNYRKSKMLDLTKIHYGTIIYPLHTREKRIELAIKYIPADIKIASKGEFHSRTDKENQDLNAIYNEIIPATGEVIFEYYRNQEFLEGLLNKQIDAPKLSLPIKEVEIQKGIKDRYIVIFPGASAKLKRWDIHKFTALTSLILKQYPELQIVVLGSEKDNEYGKIIQNTNPSVINLCGKTNLIELIELLRNAELLISNDTVSIHISAAVDTPFICVLMGENPIKFLPYPKALFAKGECIYPPKIQELIDSGIIKKQSFKPDINQIEVESVFRKVKEKLT